MKFVSQLALLTVSASALGTTSVANTLSEVGLLNRCYSQVTSNQLLPNSSLLADVTSGKKTAAEVCMSIFDKAQLQVSGAQEGNFANPSPEGVQVLKTFNDLHRTWFPNDSLVAAIPLGLENFAEVRDLHDETEAALHITRVLFTTGAKYSEVVTGDSAMEALRTQGPRVESTFRAAASPGVSSATVPLNAELVQLGTLMGIRKLSLNANKHNLQGYSGDSSVLTSSLPLPVLNAPIKIHQSLGGGIVGSKSYLLLNFGRPDNLPMDGGLRMPRRWAKTAMKDLLCRDLPALRTMDAELFVDPNPGADTPSFRGYASCMSCHATMDPMASVARNLSLSFMPQWQIPDGTSHVSTPQIAVWPVSRPREAGQVDKDEFFYLRPPNGRLFFRSYDGLLFRRAVDGFPLLGEALSETNDLYVCAASRYYQFFTGVQVNLQDIGDSSLPRLSAMDQTYRKEVIQLGTDLKKHQNLRTLIQRILESPIYKKTGMRYSSATEGI